MKPTAILFAFFCLLMPQEKQQPSNSTFNNQFFQAETFIQLLQNHEAMKELELTAEQQSKLHMATHRMRMQLHHYHTESVRETDPEVVTLLQQRLMEDLERSRKKTATDIFLPHQSELFNKLRVQKLVEHHVASGFKKIKGTALAELELSDKQVGKLDKVRTTLQEELEAERKRHLERVQKIREKAVADAKGALNRKQLEILKLEP